MKAYYNIIDPINGYGLGGSRYPAQALSVYDGESVSGLWVFSVVDKSNVGSGTFGTWSLKVKLSECPENITVDSAKVAPDRIDNIKDNDDNQDRFFNFDFIGYDKGNRNAFDEFIGLDVIVVILTTLCVLAMVYCICCRKKTKRSSKNYKQVDVDVDDETDDEIVIEEDNL